MRGGLTLALSEELPSLDLSLRLGGMVVVWIVERGNSMLLKVVCGKSMCTVMSCCVDIEQSVRALYTRS